MTELRLREDIEPGERRMILTQAGKVAVNAHVDEVNRVRWVKFSIRDLPNDLVSLDDLERLVVDRCIECSDLQHEEVRHEEDGCQAPAPAAIAPTEA